MHHVAGRTNLDRMGSADHWEQREVLDARVRGLMRLATIFAVEEEEEEREDLFIERNLSMPSDVRPHVAEGGRSGGGGMGVGANLRSATARGGWYDSSWCYNLLLIVLQFVIDSVTICYWLTCVRLPSCSPPAT